MSSIEWGLVAKRVGGKVVWPLEIIRGRSGERVKDTQ